LDETADYVLRLVSWKEWTPPRFVAILLFSSRLFFSHDDRKCT
jgi:hypothetical protein